MLRPFYAAIGLLTLLPVPAVNASDLGRSAPWFPVVGALLGTALLVMAALLGLAGIDPMLSATLVVAIWAAATGGLHLDGLGDAADALAGGHRDPSRALAIMKDPRAGPMAVVAIVLVLALKITALATLIHEASGVLIAAPVLGRAAAAGLIAGTPYAREEGMASALSQNVSKTPVRAAMALSALGAIAVLGVAPGLAACGIAAAIFWVIRQVTVLRVGGYTGDVAGALIEIVETAVLLIAVLVAA